ncbi:MAG: DUF6472 family protein [Lachnospiraceae bacterium]|nr:hypothetical protein [Lachnospiraceae bacterium]MCR5087593.1 DUF6472 family protein [Lachnospiraceae bacterium]
MTNSKHRKEASKTPTNCDYCMYYEYDEDYECYTCSKDLDEDDMAHFMSGRSFDCPFFRSGNEYAIVRKQM